tara:strand:- start:105 stop:272 length:168 start_codon:yes stop_codon:yes gene_type:complete
MRELGREFLNSCAMFDVFRAWWEWDWRRIVRIRLRKSRARKTLRLLRRRRGFDAL